VADARRITLTELASATTDNFFRLYKKARRPTEVPVLVVSATGAA
jgi:hypothetical protein